MAKPRTPRAPATRAALAQHTANIFGTPLMAHQWPDTEALNTQLRALILTREQNSPGITRSNVAGWHSLPDLFSWEHPAIATLRQYIEQAIIAMTAANTAAPQDGAPSRSFNYRLDGWANISRRGAYNTVHNHPNAIWSGVYYVANGVPDNNGPHNGRLELLDPRVGVNMLHQPGSVFAARYVIEPIPGLMLLFPGWLSHFVHPFAGSGERISIAFNVLLTEIPAAESIA